MIARSLKAIFPDQTAHTSDVARLSSASSLSERRPLQSRRIALAAAGLLVCGTMTFGCHNRDITVAERMSWMCPAIGAGHTLPRETNDEGVVTDAYKRAAAVRFTFTDAPNQSVDLYQQGLCSSLTATGAPVVSMQFLLTHSPDGKLLSYEATSVNGRDLRTALPVRSTLYVPMDKADMMAADKAEKIRVETEYNFVDPEPLIHSPAEDVFR